MELKFGNENLPLGPWLCSALDQHYIEVKWSRSSILRPAAGHTTVWALIFTEAKLLQWGWFPGWCFSLLSYWEPARKQWNVINSHCSGTSVLLCWRTWQLENDQVAAAFWFLLLFLIHCLEKWFVNALRTSCREECGFPSSQQVEPASLASCHRLTAISQKPG